METLSSSSHPSIGHGDGHHADRDDNEEEERMRSYYEECFENDVNTSEEEGNEQEGEGEEDDNLLLIIQQKKKELTEMNLKTDDFNIQIEGWSELLNSMIVQEKEYDFDVMADLSSHKEKEKEKDSLNEEMINLEKALKQTIIEDIEISDEVRDVLFGMMDSVEYISSLELEKDFFSEPFQAAVSVEKLITDLKDFDENSFVSSDSQNPLPFLTESKNISDELLKSEVKHQEALQSTIDEMEREMKEREDELRRAVEIEKQEREARRERVRKELERIHRENHFVTRIQVHVRRYLCRKAYLLVKMNIKKRKESRREKDERIRMQREEHYCLEIEKQRKLILEEEKRKAAKQLALENQSMMTAEIEMRKFLEQEKEAVLLKKQKEQKEQEEKERKEKELIQKMREDHERSEADALAKRLQKEREDQIRRETLIREEEQLKAEQIQKEKREKELKDRQKQKKNEKEKGLKAKHSTDQKSVDLTRVGSLTARVAGVFGWGGVLAEPNAHAQDESKNSCEKVVNEDNHSDVANFDLTSPVPAIIQNGSSHSHTDILGPIVSLPLCDDISAFHRITSIVHSGVSSAKEPMKYLAENSPDVNKVHENVSSQLLVDSIMHHSLVTWKEWSQHRLNPSSSQQNILPNPYVTSTKTLRQPQQAQIPTTTELKMSVENIQNLQFLGAYPSLISLECNVNQIRSLMDMSQCCCSTSLTDLALNDNQLTSLHGLESYHSLQSLYLDVNQLNDLSPIQHLPQLVTLSVKMNRFEAFPVLNIPTLQKLDLYHNRISTISSNSLESLSSLTHLDLGRNKLSTIDGHILSNCQLLSHLILSQNQLSHLPAPLYLPNLRSLWLSKNSINSLDSWVGLMPSPQSSSPWPVFLPLLERLYLQDNEITLIPKYSFVTSPLLSELDLSFNNLGDRNSMESLTSCQLLKRLQLQENPVLSPSFQTFVKQIQNSFTHLVEFCGHSIDVKKGVYAPLFPTSSEFITPMTLTEIMDQKKLLAKQRCDTIRHLKRNGWKGNVSEIFRLSEKPKSDDILELEPICSSNDQSLDSQHWKHFLSSLLAEQNIFKIREKMSMKTTADSTSHSVRGISSFVQLLRNHCQLISDWDKSLLSIPRVVFVSPSLASSQPSIQTNHPPLSRKDTKEFHAVIRARQTHAALAIQSLWRGHFTRKRLKHLLSHAKYYDEDLEQLMDAHNLTDYLGILNETLPELSDDWLRAKLNPNEGISNSATMVYGDHRRKKINSPRSEISSISHHIPITPERTNDMTRSPRGQLDAARIRSAAHIEGEWVVDEKKTEILKESGIYLNRISSVPRNADPKVYDHFPGEEEWESEELGRQLFPSINRPASSSSEFSRPASSSSTISADHATPLSTTSSQRFGKGEYHGDNEDIDMLLHTGRTRVSSTSSSSNQWGVSSRPPVHHILKRTKLSNAQAKEEEKDPALRYEKYSKIIANMGSSNINVTKGNTKTSGSFGGKPKMVRNTQQKKHTPPAWLTGPNDEGEK